MIWALFILDPSLVSRYFSVQEIDDQGRPMKIIPTSDNKELLRQSPLLIGGGMTTKIIKPSQNIPYSHVGGMTQQTGFDLYAEDRMNLLRWMMETEEPDMLPNSSDNDPEQGSSDNYYQPITLF
jgi:hypothetical protein